MDRVPAGCTKRFQLRLTDEHVRRIGWLKRRLNRSGNSIIRTALDRMFEHEERRMLEQAGYREPNR